jgi:hypothetical protein
MWAQLRRAGALTCLVAATARPCLADEASAQGGAEPASSAETAQPRRLVWRWPRFRTSEYYVTGAAGLLAAGSLVIPPNPGRWRGGILADEDVRDGLALGSYHEQRTARDASDVLVAAMIAYPVLVDGVIVTSGVHDSDDVMQQMLLIDVEVLAITSSVQLLVSGLVSRERPYGRDCGDALPEDSRDCQRRSRHRSFYSGHSAVAFAAAGLSCTHHMNLELYGGGAPDVAACGASLVTAGVVSALRIMGDVHYSSDVVIGAAWGSVTGFGLPLLLHYYEPRGQRAEDSKLRLHLVPVGLGAGLGGSF